MQTAPANWDSLWAAEDTALELRFAIDGISYGNKRIASGSATVSHYLYDSYSVGNACAGKLSITLLEPQPIARGIRECTLECRLTSADGKTKSGWLAQGTWLLNSVEYAADGSARLELFDGLALCDQYLHSKGVVPKSESYPKPAKAVVDAICDKVGIGKPSSYAGFSSVQVPAPEGLTCREVLQSIAAIAGGNFTMAKNGRLAFMPLRGLENDEATITASDYTMTSEKRTVTGLVLEGQDDEYGYGSDSFEVGGWCAWADATVGNGAYLAVRGLRYQGASASGCYLSPLVELGDQVGLSGAAACSMLVDDFKLTYSQGLWGTVAAPLRDEVEQRIKYRTSRDRKVSRLAVGLGAASSALDHMTTAEYVSELLERMNDRANETGGWTYVTEGQGLRTYDAPVSDPLVGSEAASVVEVRGGTIRIANSRHESGEHAGEWKWLTVFESGHISSELVTAVNIVTGWIGSPSGNYWNLDTGEMRLASTTTVDGKALAEYIAENSEANPDDITLTQQKVFNALTDNGKLPGIFMQNGQLYINANYLKTGIITDNGNHNYWNLSTGEFKLTSPTLTTPTVVDSKGGSVDIAEAAAKAEKASRDVSNLTIGGTNLLNGTNTLPSVQAKPGSWKTLSWGKSAYDGASSTLKVANFSGTPNPNVTRGLVASGHSFVVAVQKDIKVTPGDTYVLSCYAKKSGNGRLYMGVGQVKRAMKCFETSPGSSWKRYYFSFRADVDRGADLVDGTLSAAFGKVGGANGTVYICGMKLERGTKPTDWCPSPHDGEKYAVSEAERAYRDAKTFTNAVKEKAYKYTRDQVKVLDESYTQKKVFDRLTKNGAAQGIYLRDGRVYINGTYIKSGTIDADFLRTGIISDAKARSSNKVIRRMGSTWNLSTGTLTTSNLSIRSGDVSGELTCGFANSDRLKLTNGRIDGFYGSKRVGYIDASAATWDKDKKATRRGLQLKGEGIIRLQSPRISVATSTKPGATATYGFTGSVFLRNVTFGMNGKMTRCKTGDVELRFINGLFTGVGKYTSGLVKIKKKQR